MQAKLPHSRVELLPTQTLFDMLWSAVKSRDLLGFEEALAKGADISACEDVSPQSDGLIC